MILYKPASINITPSEQVINSNVPSGSMIRIIPNSAIIRDSSIEIKPLFLKIFQCNSYVFLLHIYKYILYT